MTLKLRSRSEEEIRFALSNHDSESRIFFVAVEGVMEPVWEKPYDFNCFLCVKKRTRVISFYVLAPYVKEQFRPDFFDEFLEIIAEFNEHTKTHAKMEAF